MKNKLTTLLLLLIFTLPLVLIPVQAAVISENVAVLPGVSASMTGLSLKANLDVLHDGERAGSPSTGDARVLYSNASTYGSYTLDLGQSYPISRVVLYGVDNATNYCNSFKVEASTNANFSSGITLLGTYSSNVTAAGAEVKFSEQNIQYIRFTDTSHEKGAGNVYFTEFEVYSDVIYNPKLAVTSTPGGSVSPNGVVTVTGDTQTFTITPNSGYRIQSALLNGIAIPELANKTAVQTYTTPVLTADGTFDVIFAEDKPIIMVTSNPGGKVSPEGYVAVERNRTQTFTITPDAGYLIKSVKYNGAVVLSNILSATTFTTPQVTQDASLEVEFAENKPVITIIKTAGGSVSPDNSIAVSKGATQTFTITPAANYYIESVLYDGTVVLSDISGSTTYTTPPVHGDAVLNVIFAIDTSKLNQPNDFLNLAMGANRTAGNAYINDGLVYAASTSVTFPITGPVVSSAPKYFGYSFSESKIINSVVLYEYSKQIRIEDFEVQYSNDGVDYTTITKVAGIGTNGGMAVIDFEPVLAKYIRIAVTKASGNVYIAELEVYYKASVDIPKKSNLLLNEVLSGVPVNGSADTGLAYDNNENTVWKTSGSSNASLHLTLKKNITFNSIGLKLEGVSNLGITKVLVGGNEVYYDDLTLSEKNIFFAHTINAKELEIHFSELKGNVGIKEIGLFYHTDDAAKMSYINNTITYIGEYINTQLHSADTAKLPDINGTVYTSSQPSYAKISGNTLSLVGKQDGMVYLSATIDFGSNVTQQVNIPISKHMEGGEILPNIQPSNPYIYSPSVESSFSDIENCWAKSYIQALAKLKIISGRSHDIFAPNDTITRGEFVKLLVETMDLKEEAARSAFSDVGEQDWYAPYIASLEAKNLLGEIWVDAFHPNAPISREDMAFLSFQALKMTGVTAIDQPSTFADGDYIADYAKAAVSTLNSMDILSGSDNNYYPKDNLTRAEASKIIFILYQYNS